MAEMQQEMRGLHTLVRGLAKKLQQLGHRLLPGALALRPPVPQLPPAAVAGAAIAQLTTWTRALDIATFDGAIATVAGATATRWKLLLHFPEKPWAGKSPGRWGRFRGPGVLPHASSRVHA